ncbi:MAG TPA: hypothetical protein P5195_04460 [Anaerolineae bacterium]|nr:hypothetical protein [Anaerolineae bacterium]HRU94469.1 hypothetical protein [Anaerolineae bacterium]
MTMVLERILEHRGIKQQWLARQLKVSDSYLSLLLAGKKPWTPQLRAETARVLMLPENVLFLDLGCNQKLEERQPEETA